MKFLNHGVEIEAIQYHEGENEYDVASLVRVPGACHGASIGTGLRFGLNGAWQHLYDEQWAVRYGDDMYDCLFMDDRVFKIIFAYPLTILLQRCIVAPVETEKEP